MADLDDFFAKKDKKKKTKKVFLTPEELAKKLEDTSKKSEVKPPPQQPPRKELPKPIQHQPTITNDGEAIPEKEIVPEVEEEWKDFKETEEKDYTGLKIAQLVINDEEEGSGSGPEGEYDENDTDGEGNTNERRRAGPWKAVVPAEEVTQIPMPEPSKPASLYVSPAFKASKGPKGRNKIPDITNEEFFPTLGAARPEEQRKKKNEPSFEEVKHGGRAQRIQDVNKKTEQQPVIGNRYGSLAEEDS